MRALLTIFVLTFAVQSAYCGATWSSYHDGKRYDFMISDGELAKTPVWKESNDNPPLPARKALRLARAELSELVSNSKAWALEGLSLREFSDSRWVYLAVFHSPLPPGGLDGFSAPITIPVLMTGVALKPKVTAIFSPAHNDL